MGVRKQGITNMLALPIDKMFYMYILCPTLNTNEIHFNLNSLNIFTKNIGSHNVKLIPIR